MFGLIFTGRMSCTDAHCHPTSAPRAQIQYVIDEGPRQTAAAGPMIAPPFKGTDPSRCFARDVRLHSVVRADPVFGLTRCSLLLPRRGSGCAFRRRAWRLEAITTIDIDVGDTHIAAFLWARTGVPVPAAGAWRARGLCIRRLHPNDHSQNAQASDQSALH